MKLYVNGFWSGFIEKTNPVHIGFFYDLLSNVFDTSIELGTFEESDILLESIFYDTTYLDKKNWKYSFLFSGESRLPYNYKNYSCVLYGQKNNNNVVNVPLFIPYIYCNNYNLINTKQSTNIPQKNVIAIISNPNGLERNYFLDQLEKRVPIDHGGNYKNNIPLINYCYNTDEFNKEIGNYKFVISMENSRDETYITEKIIHGFVANVIPIYWGSLFIKDYFNANRFLSIQNMNNKQEVDSIIDKIEQIINDPNKYLDIVNTPTINNDRCINDIVEDIQNVLFSKYVSKIFFICAKEYEPIRYERLLKMCTSLGLKKYQYKFICPTYKHTFTDIMMTRHIKYNLVRNIRYLGMKKSEVSLCINYYKVLQYIVTNYNDGNFLIFESDVYTDPINIDKLQDFLGTFATKKDWDLIHIGKSSEQTKEEFFNIPYIEGTLPYRQSINHLPTNYIEDITNENDSFRLVRKFHTRCTDSFLWTYQGIVKFYNYINNNPYFDAPFDYYLIQFLETHMSFKHYWSLDSFFIQGSNYGLEESTIQKDIT